VARGRCWSTCASTARASTSRPHGASSPPRGPTNWPSRRRPRPCTDHHLRFPVRQPCRWPRARLPGGARLTAGRSPWPSRCPAAVAWPPFPRRRPGRPVARRPATRCSRSRGPMTSRRWIDSWRRCALWVTIWIRP